MLARFSNCRAARRHDALGNIYGRLEGAEAGSGAVASGSHADAIPLSGKYDGVYGVLGAIAALRALRLAARSLYPTQRLSRPPVRPCYPGFPVS